MSDENQEVKFNYSIANAKEDQNFKYLLNFWYTTKINKQNGFIKRNGVHPKIDRYVTRERNTFRIRGTQMSTNFFTVFRIFLTKVFNKSKIKKLRDQDAWEVTFNKDEMQLDNPVYLLLYYTRENITTADAHSYYPFKINPPSRWSRDYGRPLTRFGIILNKRDCLYSKAVYEGLIELDHDASIHIDEKITKVLESLSHDIFIYMPKYNFDELSAKIKVRDALGLSYRHHDGGIAATDVQAAVHALNMAVDANDDLIDLEELEEPEEIEVTTPYQIGLDSLLDTWDELSPRVRTMPSRMIFSYVLNYAQAAGNNPIIDELEDTDANYEHFMGLVGQREEV